MLLDVGYAFGFLLRCGDVSAPWLVFLVCFIVTFGMFIDLGFFQIKWYSIAYIMGIILGWSYALKIIKKTQNKISEASVEWWAVQLARLRGAGSPAQVQLVRVGLRTTCQRWRRSLPRNSRTRLHAGSALMKNMAAMSHTHRCSATTISSAAPASVPTFSATRAGWLVVI